MIFSGPTDTYLNSAGTGDLDDFLWSTTEESMTAGTFILFTQEYPQVQLTDL